MFHHPNLPHDRGQGLQPDELEQPETRAENEASQHAGGRMHATSDHLRAWKVRGPAGGIRLHL